MTCQELEPQLSPFVDGELAGDERAAVVAHLDACAACRGLVSDLEQLRASARVLGPISPPDHLWIQVAGQIHLGANPRTAVTPHRRSRPGLAQWFSLAAALVVVTLGVYLVEVLQSPRSGAPGTAQSSSPVGSVENVAQELSLALEHYDKAISELQVITEKNSGDLDPAVASTVQKNLKVIDHAIVESRAALVTDPESAPARDSLLDALRRKIGVLQTTVALMNEMRKGDAAGAARVVGGKS
jgi:hypothetical protein